LADQIAQVGHACLEAGRRFEQPPTPTNLVVLAVASRSALEAALEAGRLAGVRTAAFIEPDRDLGLTAACSEPVAGQARRCFGRFALWAAPGLARPPPGR